MSLSNLEFNDPLEAYKHFIFAAGIAKLSLKKAARERQNTSVTASF